MKVHSDIIIFELLHLYFEVTENTEIDLKLLEKGFYTLITIIKEANNFNINFDFQSELELFLDTYSDYIKESENKIELTEEIKNLFNAIMDNHPILSTIDYDTQRDIFDTRIYQALNIKVSYHEVEEYFELNQKIIRLYLKLGENELHNYHDDLIFKRLAEAIAELNDLLNELESSNQMKLKVFFNNLNERIFPNTEETDLTSSWNLILFSNSSQKLYTLSYDRIEYLVELIDPKEDDENEEVLDNFYQENSLEQKDEEDKKTYKLDDTSYFLTFLLIELNNYIKSHHNTNCKEALLIKKYLLISIPDLNHVEKYFLENHTIENYPEPSIPEDLDTNSFESLKNKVIECTTYLAKKNLELTKPHILANVITASLFIKTFLDISINPDSIQDIIDLITNSVFYKKPNYETVTNIVDEIIFTDSPNLQR